MTSCVLLSAEEHRQREDARRAGPDHSMVAHFPPGTMWLCPWYHDPSDPEELSHVEHWLERARANPDGNHFLSIHYLERWARIRAPICVMCPTGKEWCVDAKSSNGSGWTVTGEAPLITCSPSIDVGTFHGFLKDGVFSAA